MATPYLTPAEVRERRPQLADDTIYGDDELASLVAEFEEIAETYAGVAFTPREATAVVLGPAFSVVLHHWPVRSITSVIVDGAEGDPASYLLYTERGWLMNGPLGAASELVVTYSHGYDAPPADLLRACAEYVRATAMADRSGQSRDVVMQSFDGGMTRYSSPNWAAGRPTGFLEVDRLLARVRENRVGGIA